MPVGRDMLDHMRHLTRPLAVRLANTVGRALVTLVDDSLKLQLLQIGALAGETIERAEHHQAYGVSSVPLPGAEAVVVFPNGDRGHPLVVAVSDRRYRPSGRPAGEVCLYTDEGDVIRLGRGHVISLETTGTVKLGSSSATQAAIKGTQRNTAEQTFLTALSTFVSAVGGLPGMATPATNFGTAITDFGTAVAGALSTKIKLE